MIPITTPYNQTMLFGTRWGSMIALTCDPFQSASLSMYGEWARAECDAMCSFLKPGDVAIDVGANIGTMTVALAKRVGVHGLVIAFEPQRIAFMCLCGNVALTHTLAQVRCLNAAAGDSEGIIKVPVVDLSAQFNVGGMRLDDPDYDVFTRTFQREDVPLMTIDSMALGRVDLIKIDVETMESKVLAGASETIKRCRPVIFAEALRNDCFNKESTVEDDNLSAMTAFFKSQDYEARFLETLLFDEDNRRYNPDNVFPGGDRNIVAIHKDAEKPDWWLKLEITQ